MFKEFFTEALDSYDKKKYNKTLKVSFSSYEQKLWDYYRTDKSIGKWIKAPTVSTIEKWYNFWKDKVEFSELDIEYFEFVISKKKGK